MLPKSLGLLSLGAAAVNGFQNTSPFFLSSTSEILDKSSSSQVQIQTATWLLDEVYSKLASCPSDYYVIASQPGVHSSDFSTSKAAPRLGAKVLKQDQDIKSSLIVNEVVNVLDAKQIRDMIKNCGAENTVIDALTGSYPKSLGGSPRVITVDFPMLSLGSDRKQQLQDNDGFLADIIDRLDSSKYTLLYVTSPREYLDSDSATCPPSDENPYQDPLHMELKRDYSAHTRREESTSKSLFQEYQYLTPGLFMGLLASFFLLLILYVGLSALTSLQVPYAAFERDTSASVQKKQQ